MYNKREKKTIRGGRRKKCACNLDKLRFRAQTFQKVAFISENGGKKDFAKRVEMDDKNEGDDVAGIDFEFGWSASRILRYQISSRLEFCILPRCFPLDHKNAARPPRLEDTQSEGDEGLTRIDFLFWVSSYGWKTQSPRGVS